MQQQSHSEEQLLGNITLEPQTTTEFYVGLYEDVIPQPITRLEFKNGDEKHLHTSLVRLDGPGEYTLIYNLHNPSAAACHLKIYATWREDIDPFKSS